MAHLTKVSFYISSWIRKSTRPVIYIIEQIMHKYHNAIKGKFKFSDCLTYRCVVHIVSKVTHLVCWEKTTSLAFNFTTAVRIPFYKLMPPCTFILWTNVWWQRHRKFRTRSYLCSEEWHRHTCCCGSMKSGGRLARMVRIAFWTDSSSSGNPSDIHLKAHSRTKKLPCNYTHKNIHTIVSALYFRKDNLTWRAQGR
jgi:hypothetical protein